MNGAYDHMERASDRSSPCAIQAVPSGSSVAFGAYDIDSVMSYCGTYDGRDGLNVRTPRLSVTDVASTQSLFGQPYIGALQTMFGYCASVYYDPPSRRDRHSLAFCSPSQGTTLTNGVIRSLRDPAQRCWGPPNATAGETLRTSTTCGPTSALTFRFEGVLETVGGLVANRVTYPDWGALYLMSAEATIAGLRRVTGERIIHRGDGKLYVGSRSSNVCVGRLPNWVGPKPCASPDTTWEWLPDGTVRLAGTNLCLTTGNQTYAQFASGSALPTGVLSVATCGTTRYQYFRLRGQLMNDQTGACVEPTTLAPGTVVDAATPLFTLGSCIGDQFYYRPLTPPSCGDGVRNTTELCDDGNTVSGDGCSSTCELEGVVCGDGVTQGWEQCDTGEVNHVCRFASDCADCLYCLE